MNTPLQSTGMMSDELALSDLDAPVEEHGEAEHIHLPGPSYWPIFISVALLITFVGLLFINSTPVLVIIGAVLALIGIVGWGVENPMAPRAAAVKPGEFSTSFAEAAISGKPTPLAQAALRDAEDVVEQTVTIASTAWSAHPVKVFVEREGVVLSLYGKVELEAQKQEVEKALRKMPGVIDVMNFLVAEDELLNAVNKTIDELKASGKLEGATNIHALVENYIVSLYGEVPKPEMKYLLEREITTIPGARVVINHIGLNKDIPGEMGKTSNRIARI
ncbi:MAG TPA: BON domain-containing protein [Ktedonobacteraceae bacterium]|nr:BON domain-containing protein [Ktedonobacteraceae bacterium]